MDTAKAANLCVANCLLVLARLTGIRPQVLCVQGCRSIRLYQCTCWQRSPNNTNSATTNRRYAPLC